LLLELGVNPKIVSEMAGHSGVAITLDLYSHVLPGMHQEAARVLGDALGHPGDSGLDALTDEVSVAEKPPPPLLVGLTTGA
jgi:hypothetical protein